METGKIYKISNNFDEKLYIGQSWNLDERWKNHCKPCSGCPKLKNSIQAHGKENFNIKVIWEGECNQEELDKKEIFFIKFLNTMSPSGYNLTEGGEGGKPSDETRAKMSEAHKGEKHHMFGKKQSEETRAKMSEAMKGENNPMFGKKQSEETLRKRSEARYIPVEQWSLDGKMFIKVFESIKLAAHSTGTGRQGITANLSGKQKTSGGFVWRRVKEKESDLTNDEPV